MRQNVHFGQLETGIIKNNRRIVNAFGNNVLMSTMLIRFNSFSFISSQAPALVWRMQICSQCQG